MLLSGLSTGSVILGVALGIPAGMAIQFTRRALHDLQVAKARVPVLRRIFWGSVGRVIKWGIVGIIAAIIMFSWIANEAGGGKGLFPASHVSGSPSPSPTASHHG